jgi:Holliday junction resolvase RusA-like endonuclease
MSKNEWLKKLDEKGLTYHDQTAPSKRSKRETAKRERSDPTPPEPSVGGEPLPFHPRGEDQAAKHPGDPTDPPTTWRTPAPGSTYMVREVLVQTFPVEPMGKPRQTKRDRWQKRKPVVRYRKLCDAIRRAADGWDMPKERTRLVFYIPRPKSYPHRPGCPHHLKPDYDNLAKAVLDALRDEDRDIFDQHVTKYWCEPGNERIEVYQLHTSILSKP